MPKARLVFDGDNVYIGKDGRIYWLKNDIATKIDWIPWVIDNLSSTSTTDALSANMGRDLQDQINAMSWIGTFLSTWDCTTWLPDTNPQQDPYTYKVWDYYIVSTVGATNYKPHWWTFTQWVPSTTVETENVWINDKYYFDWADWVRIPNTAIQITIDSVLSTSSTNAVENRAIANAVNAKQDIISDLSTIRTWASKWATALQPNDNISQLVNNVGYQTAGDVAAAIAWKQDILSAWDWISLLNNIVTNTKPGTAVSNTAPSNPTEWMLRYDTVNHVLKIYNWTTWETVDTDTDTTYTAWEWIEIKSWLDYSAMQWPCPDGYHVGSDSEWDAIITIMTTLSWADRETHLKMPNAWERDFVDSNPWRQNTDAYYWTCTRTWARALVLHGTSGTGISVNYIGNWCSIRPIKDIAVVPDSWWTTLFDGSSIATDAGIFHNSTDWIISLSADGTTWMTIADKNLWATTVFNYGDTLSQANCWNYYQWWNNYGFPFTWTVTTSSTDVDVSAYWPWNYYTSSTFITQGAWDSPRNNNLWWWETWVVTIDNAITNTGVLSVNGQTWHINVNDAKASATAPSSPAEWDLWYDTVNHVLKIYNWTSWETVDTDTNTTYTAWNGINIDADNEISVDTTVVPTYTDVNTKTFYLSSSSDLTTAQAAYDWHNAGKNPVIIYNDTVYVIDVVTAWWVTFLTADTYWDVISNNHTRIGKKTIVFTVTSWNVTSISTQWRTTVANVLATNQNYSSPYTPAYDWSPATKKYVDDSVAWAISSGSTAPANPVQWQLWYDTVNNKLFVYDWTNWVELWTLSGLISWTTFGAFATACQASGSLHTSTLNKYYKSSWGWVISDRWTATYTMQWIGFFTWMWWSANSWTVSIAVNWLTIWSETNSSWNYSMKYLNTPITLSPGDEVSVTMSQYGDWDVYANISDFY